MGSFSDVVDEEYDEEFDELTESFGAPEESVFDALFELPNGEFPWPTKTIARPPG